MPFERADFRITCNDVILYLNYLGHNGFEDKLVGVIINPIPQRKIDSIVLPFFCTHILLGGEGGRTLSSYYYYYININI